MFFKFKKKFVTVKEPSMLKKNKDMIDVLKRDFEFQLQKMVERDTLALDLTSAEFFNSFFKK